MSWPLRYWYLWPRALWCALLGHPLSRRGTNPIIPPTGKVGHWAACWCGKRDESS